MFVPLCQRYIVNLGMVFLVTAKEIAETILQLCAEKNISVNKLAKLSGIAQSTIDSILKGKSKNPQMTTLDKIAEGFGMSPSEFWVMLRAKSTKFSQERLHFADRLKNLRESKGLSVKELSETLQINEDNYYYLETPLFSPSLEDLFKLADFYNVSTDYLLGRTDNPTRL